MKAINYFKRVVTAHKSWQIFVTHILHHSKPLTVTPSAKDY